MVLKISIVDNSQIIVSNIRNKITSGKTQEKS